MPKKKRNRDILMEQSIYDLLCDMNASFMTGNPHCILETIEGKPIEKCRKESCNECIAEWLNSFPF